MHACMHACMHVCMYVCMHILYVYVYIRASLLPGPPQATHINVGISCYDGGCRDDLFGCCGGQVAGDQELLERGYWYAVFLPS